MNGPIVDIRLKRPQNRGSTGLLPSQDWHLDFIKAHVLVFAYICPVISLSVGNRRASIYLSVHRVVNLGQLPEAELLLDLVFHLYDEVEGLDEVRRLFGAILSKVGEVRLGEPVCEPELEVEEAVELLFECLKEVLLFQSTQRVSLSHLSMLKTKRHLSKRPLD